MTTPAFREAVEPTPLAWLVLLGLVLLPVAVVLALAVRDGDGRIALAAGLAILIPATIAVTVRPNRIEIAGGELRLRAGLARLRLPLADVDQDTLRRVDLDERTELKPRWKTFGTGLPGPFWAGWFRLRDGRKAFLLVNRTDRVTCVETADGTVLLLALQQPERFRRALAQSSTM